MIVDKYSNELAIILSGINCNFYSTFSAPPILLSILYIHFVEKHSDRFAFYGFFEILALKIDAKNKGIVYNRKDYNQIEILLWD